MNIYCHNYMFLDNIYTKIYYRIIERSFQENREKNNGIYYEQHHILPRSLFPEYAKDPQNLVLLTAKEHFICHRLLTRMTKGIPCVKMKIAVERMTTGRLYQKRYIPNSRVYQIIRKEHAESISIINKGRSIGIKWYNNGINNYYGKICPKGYQPGRIMKNDLLKQHKGKKWYNNGTDQQLCLECPIGWSPGRLPWNDDWKKKQSKSQKGKKASNETKLKMSKSLKGKGKGMKWYNDGQIQVKAYECPVGFAKGQLQQTIDIRSRSQTGKKQSQETIAKRSRSLKGKNADKHWFNNGIIECRTFACPAGFVNGRLK